MSDRGKVWYAGRASQEELDEIDRCNLCEILREIKPELKNTCYAREYCHRQMRMEIDKEDQEDE